MDPSLVHVPGPVLDVLRALGDAGHRSWLVGGAVRDLVLGREHPGADLDVATPATPAEVQRIFPRVIPTGIEHGTVTVLHRGDRIEVTTFRGEGAYLDGRRPSSVTFLRDIDGDLARRDFTMNAIALDPLARELRDPFGGEADIAVRLIRAVGDAAARFAEDGLRPLRAVRFAAQLGFALEPATEAAIPGALAVTLRVAAERVHDELEKLLAAPEAARGLALLDRTGLLEVLAPELAAHPRRTHAVQAASRAARPLARLAALLHVLGPDAAAARVERLRFPNAERDDVAALLRSGGCVLDGGRAVPAAGAATRRWLASATVRLAPEALDQWRADAETPEQRAAAALAAERIAAELATRPPLEVSALALDGRGVMQALGTPPGRHVGEALRYLLEQVLEDPARNERPYLVDAVRRWWSSRNLGVR
jgi:tRNA nucleotidyltransferase (CCA-adding enzyme)